MQDTARNLGDENTRRDATPALAIRGLQKSYGATVALAGVDLEVEAGTILGLLGPNGAGKTSLVSIVAGLRRPDAGTVHVGGIDVVRAPQRARGLIGLAPQETGVYPPLSVRDNLRFFAGLAGLRRARAAGRASTRSPTRSVSTRCSTGGRPSSRAASGAGCTPRSRCCTGRSLVLLDEPTTGADVRTRIADPAARARARRRRIGGRLLDALPPRDRGARRVRHVHRPGRIVATRQHRRARPAVRIERARAHVRRRRSRRRARRRCARRRIDGAHPGRPTRPSRPPSCLACDSDRAPRICGRSRSCGRASNRCSSRSPVGATTRRRVEPVG